jgi:hypothetical protein
LLALCPSSNTVSTQFTISMSHTLMTGDMLPTAHRLPASQTQYLCMLKTQIYSKSLLLQHCSRQRWSSITLHSVSWAMCMIERDEPIAWLQEVLTCEDMGTLCMLNVLTICRICNLAWQRWCKGCWIEWILSSLKGCELRPHCYTDSYQLTNVPHYHFEFLSQFPTQMFSVLCVKRYCIKLLNTSVFS